MQKGTLSFAIVYSFLSNFSIFKFLFLTLFYWISRSSTDYSSYINVLFHSLLSLSSYLSKHSSLSIAHLSLSPCYTITLTFVLKSIDFASKKHPFYTSKAMLLPSNNIAFTRPLYITSDTTALTPPHCRTPKTKEMHSVWARKKNNKCFGIVIFYHYLWTKRR